MLTVFKGVHLLSLQKDEHPQLPTKGAFVHQQNQHAPVTNLAYRALDLLSIQEPHTMALCSTGSQMSVCFHSTPVALWPPAVTFRPCCCAAERRSKRLRLALLYCQQRSDAGLRACLVVGKICKQHDMREALRLILGGRNRRSASQIGRAHV